MNYPYLCKACGDFESQVNGDRIQCRCGRIAKRIRSFAVNRSSLKPQGRWDPVVGMYVRNDREFRDALARGQAAESEALGMDVQLATVDARDREGLAELHGHGVDERAAVAEQTNRAKHDERVKANNESLVTAK